MPKGKPTAAQKELRRAHRERYEDQFAGILKTAGRDLPTPERHHRFDPTRKWEMDFVWIQDRVAVEIDGGNRKAVIVPTKRGARAIPVGRHTKPEDLDRCNEAESQGWHVLHVAPEMLASPDRILSQLRRLVGLPFCEHADPLGVRVPVMR